MEVLGQYLYGECLERLEQSEAVERFEQFERGSAYVSSGGTIGTAGIRTYPQLVVAGRHLGPPPMTSE